MRNKLAALLLSALVLLTAAPAGAVSTLNATLTTTAWTDLGAGPLQVQAMANGAAGGVGLVIADTVPSLVTAPKFQIGIGQVPMPFQTTSHVYAIALTPNGIAPVVTYAPVTAAGGGGGSTTATITAPLGPSTAAASAVATTFATGTTLPAFATPPSVVVSGPLGPSTATANSVAIVPGAGSLFVVNAGVNSASSLWGSVNNATSVSGGIATLSRIPSSAATTNLTGVKSTAGRVYVVRGCNTTASTIYLKTYNIAVGSVTVGTSTVFDTFAFPPNSCFPSVLPYGDIGSFYSVAISYAFTANPADNDATAIAAGAIVGFVMGWL